MNPPPPTSPSPRPGGAAGRDRGGCSRAALRPLARALLGAVITALVALACVWPASAAAGVDDWVHIWEVVQLVQAQPPGGPVIYYLGDSTARESTVDDESWTGQLQTRAVAAGKSPLVVAYTLAGHNQTFAMDQAIVNALPDAPKGSRDAIVLIGVGLSRFIGAPRSQDPAVVDPLPVAPPYLSEWQQHHYDDRGPLSASRKRELVPRWMDRRWAGFKRNRAANLAAIDDLIKLCKGKNLRPILFELPLNLAAVRDGLDKPRDSYRNGCRALAREHRIKYLSFVRSLGLRSSGFWDLMHLLPAGYRPWQSRLSSEMVKLIPQTTAL